MKKRNIATILFSVIIAGLASITGCDNSSETPDSQNNISSTDSIINTSNNSENSEITDSEPQKPELSEEAKKLLSQLKKQSFTGPDGENVQAADAIDIYKHESYGGFLNDGDPHVTDENGNYLKDENGNFILTSGNEWVDTHLKYDFAYISYANPYFTFFSVDDPEKEQSKLDEPRKEIEKLNSNRKWLKVKAGDKLENGLTVTKAECEVVPIAKTHYYSMALQLSGEFTMEGILEYQERGNYLTAAGNGLFYADPTVTNGVPILFNNTKGSYSTIKGYRTASIACDGQDMVLGMIDDLNLDMNEIFPDGRNLARVKITFRDPFFYVDDSTDQMRSGDIFIKDVNIVGIERVEEQ